jgi:hypothetical protein
MKCAKNGGNLEQKWVAGEEKLGAGKVGLDAILVRKENSIS